MLRADLPADGRGDPGPGGADPRHVRGVLGAGGAALPHEDDVTQTVTERVFQQRVLDLALDVAVGTALRRLRTRSRGTRLVSRPIRRAGRPLHPVCPLLLLVRPLRLWRRVGVGRPVGGSAQGALVVGWSGGARCRRVGWAQVSLSGALSRPPGSLPSWGFSHPSCPGGQATLRPSPSLGPRRPGRSVWLGFVLLYVDVRCFSGDQLYLHVHAGSC